MRHNAILELEKNVAGETQGYHTSLAIWDIPPTVVAGERFTIKAGAKSSVDRSLHGQRIEVLDAAGTAIASAELGSARWPGTSALYWTEVALPAPAQPGMATLSVRFAAAGLAPPHRAAAATVAVMVVPPPQHILKIQVAGRETATPICNAEIRIGSYRAATDASGRAELQVAKGQYHLQCWKIGYDAPLRIVDIDSDASIEIAAATVPEENADRAWRG
jgi:hypothetical protein